MASPLSSFSSSMSGSYELSDSHDDSLNVTIIETPKSKTALVWKYFGFHRQPHGGVVVSKKALCKLVESRWHILVELQTFAITWWFGIKRNMTSCFPKTMTSLSQHWKSLRSLQPSIHFHPLQCEIIVLLVSVFSVSVRLSFIQLFALNSTIILLILQLFD